MPDNELALQARVPPPRISAPAGLTWWPAPSRSVPAAQTFQPVSMDLLDRLLGHDRWTTRTLLLRAAELDDELLDVEFELGHRTLRATLDHIVFNVEVWSHLMAGRHPDVRRRRPEERTIEGMLSRLESAYPVLEEVAGEVRARNGWDEQWTDVLDDPPARKSYGGAIAHVITHSMHHRAQVLAMLRWCGATDLPEGDVLGWEGQRRGP
jgi:uncharacterized damage-inducible protein DinB